MTTKIYIAARYLRREEMEDVADDLKDLGYTVTARWVYGGEEGLTRGDIAVLDLEDVDKADTIVLFTEPYKSAQVGGGRFVEFGYALAKGKRCVIIGERENVFCHHSSVEQFDTLEDFIQKEYEDYV